MAVTEPIRDKKKLKEMADYYLHQGNLRNHVLIVMGVHTALRISDLLQLKWEDVYNFEKRKFETHISLAEKKTGKIQNIALNQEVIRALKHYLPQRNGHFLFPNNRKKAAAISRVQAYRIIRRAAESAGIYGTISCHSLRKTFGYHAWKSGVPVILLMDIFNHSSFAVTRRYLGICQDDLDNVHLKMVLF